MTICNMSIEGGARAGLIAPDDTTFEYLHGRRHAPQGAAWDAAVAALADAADRRRRGLRQDDHHRRERPRADGHLRHEPGHGHPDHQPRPVARRPGRSRPSAARSSTRSSTWTCSPARRSSARRSTSSSSGAARTAGSATCASPPRSSRTGTWRTACALMVVPGSDEVKREAERGGPRRDLQGRRRRVARGRLLDVHRDERRPAPARGSTPSAPATATSRAVRARAGGRSSPRR